MEPYYVSTLVKITPTDSNNSLSTSTFEIIGVKDGAKEDNEIKDLPSFFLNKGISGGTKKRRRRRRKGKRRRTLNRK